jgi:RNA polymerase sigma-70 factor (ECF subfamily)
VVVGVEELAQHADEELLRALYAEHATPLFGFVLHLLDGDRHSAEDIVQKTLLEAWRHPEALTEQRENVRPWLWTVARRLVIDSGRSRQVRSAEVPEQLLAAVPMDDDLDQALEAWQVADALASLTPDHRAVLVGTYFRGESVAEAAAVLRVPPGTVKSRAYYAMRELHLLLVERGVTS